MRVNGGRKWVLNEEDEEKRVKMVVVLLLDIFYCFRVMAKAIY